MSLLFRLVVREMLGPFLFGLGAFTILFFAVDGLAGLARIVLDSKLGTNLLLEYLLNRLPQVMIFTCPMAVLLSGLTAFGRLSGDSELTALKAAGISFFRIATPALLLCTAISGVNLYLNEHVVPRSMKRAYDIMIEAQKRDPFHRALLMAPRKLKNGETQVMYVHTFDAEKKILYGVVIHFFVEQKRKRQIFAEEAHWDEKRRVWVLKHLRTTFYDEAMDPTQEVVASDTWTPMQPDESPQDPDTLVRREYRPEELSRQEIAQILTVLPAGRTQDERRKRNRYEVMFHQKLSLPWTSLIFGAFAIPLGVRPQRSSRSIGLGLSLLFILIYYVLMTVGVILGEAGQITAQTAAWLPNILFGAMGLILLLDATRK